MSGRTLTLSTLVAVVCTIAFEGVGIAQRSPDIPMTKHQPANAADEDDPEAALSRIRGKIQALLAKPQPALFERHLRSVLALCEENDLQTRFAGTRQNDMRRDLLRYFRIIEAGLNQDADRPETYLINGTRPLILARLSTTDDSLQFYSVSLPPHWDPNRAYPVWVQLHGAGISQPAAFMSYALGPHSAEQKPGPDGIVLMPFLRGNLLWMEGGDYEADLWEAIADLKSFAKTDPDRWYLSGASAGGDATWAIVQRTPDLWAAAGMMAGSTYAAPVDLGLVSNMSHLPFYIWSGDEDPTHRLPSAEEARDALTAVGNPPQFVIAKGVGHMYRFEDLLQMGTWMLEHTRRRPNHFSFIIDTPRYRGVWGIIVPRKYPQVQPVTEPRAKFECWVDGTDVRIKTWGAQKLSVNLGIDGLRLSGNVTLIVNNKAVYQGVVPDKPISLSW